VVVIDTTSKATQAICTGADFYSQPRFSHDGKWVSWNEWSHPDMPWIGSQLYVAEWQDGKIGEPVFIAGEAGKEAIGEPKWHSYGGLMFSSDKTGFHQLYMYDPASTETRRISVKGFEDADLACAANSSLAK
jgi:hypothetical protein